MAKTREIKGRLKAVGNIKRITRTMQMIATSKFQAALRRATASKPYTQKVRDLVTDLAQAVGGTESIEHPLLAAPTPPVGRRLLLVISSNRGLCGGYNGNILRTAAEFVRSRPDETFDIEAVGRKGIAFFRFSGFHLAATHTHFSDQPAFDQVNALAKRYMQEFEQGVYDRVQVVYMQFISNAKQVPTVQTLLPLERPTAEDSDAAAKSAGSQITYDFSPDATQILHELLPVTVKTQLFQCFNDAVVSEQIARMVAMKAATDNADEMGRNLKRQYNRARQAQITKELIEVVSGAEALI
jgi:F-type H+-transporting ATPase subunit gamma